VTQRLISWDAIGSKGHHICRAYKDREIHRPSGNEEGRPGLADQAGDNSPALGERGAEISVIRSKLGALADRSPAPVSLVRGDANPATREAAETAAGAAPTLTPPGAWVRTLFRPRGVGRDEIRPLHLVFVSDIRAQDAVPGCARTAFLGRDMVLTHAPGPKPLPAGAEKL